MPPAAPVTSATGRKIGIAFLCFIAFILAGYWIFDSSAPFPAFILLAVIFFMMWKLHKRNQALNHDLRNLLGEMGSRVGARLGALEAAVAQLKTAENISGASVSPPASSAAVAAKAGVEPAPPQPTPAPPIGPIVWSGRPSLAPQIESVLDSGRAIPPLDHSDAPSAIPPQDATTVHAGAQSEGGQFNDLFARQIIAGRASRFSFASSLHSMMNLEEMLGENWLSKLGVVILVLGIAFFLAWQLREVGPAGKVVVGVAASLALLAAGIFTERFSRYRLLARGAVGGGWALLFFTAYAMYHVPAARVLTSQVSDLFLMFVVAAVMVVHTLRYQSQLVTGLTFLLAFSTIALNRDPQDVYGLSANLILAAGLSVVAVRMRWLEMEVFGILAAYLNHYFWLQPIIAPMGSHHHPFPEFYASTGLLILYWAVFRASYIVRPPGLDENVSSVAALLNTFLLLGVLKYQSVYKWMAFWALLFLGAVEFSLGQLSLLKRRTRRQPFIILTLLGAGLLLAAIPFRYAPEYVSIIWLAEAEIFLMAGILTGEIWFRRVGLLAAFPIAVQMLAVDAARVMGMRFDGAYVVPVVDLSMIFALASLLFYGNAHPALRPPALRPKGESPELQASLFDVLLLRHISCLAAILIFVGAWLAFPRSYAAVAWMLISLALAWAAQRFKLRELGIQSSVMAALAVLRVLSVNLKVHDSYALGAHHLRVRLVTILLVAILLYATSIFKRKTLDRLSFLAEDAGALFTWPATMLLGLLAWYELAAPSVALAWVLLALVLFEIGFMRQALHLRLQAYLGSLLVFFRLFFANLNVVAPLHQFSPRIYTVVPVAVAFFYIYHRLRDREEDFLRVDRRFRAAEAHAWLSMLTLAALVRFEAPLDWVAAAWSAMVLVLVGLAFHTGRRIFLRQAILLSLVVCARAILHNLYVRSYFAAPFLDNRWLCVGGACVLMFLALPLAFRLRQLLPAGETRRWWRVVLDVVDRRPEQFLFFIPMLLFTLLVAVEMRKGLVTMTWGLFGVVVFLLALRIGERSFRLAGVGLLLLCVGKIVLVDIWGLNIRDRALTFIVLGGSLLLVSILYTKHRESIRQYL